MLNLTGIIRSLVKKVILSDGNLKGLGSLTANNQYSNVILEKKISYGKMSYLSV